MLNFETQNPQIFTQTNQNFLQSRNYTQKMRRNSRLRRNNIPTTMILNNNNQNINIEDNENVSPISIHKRSISNQQKSVNLDHINATYLRKSGQFSNQMEMIDMYCSKEFQTNITQKKNQRFLSNQTSPQQQPKKIQPFQNITQNYWINSHQSSNQKRRSSRIIIQAKTRSENNTTNNNSIIDTTNIKSTGITISNNSSILDFDQIAQNPDKENEKDKMRRNSHLNNKNINNISSSLVMKKQRSRSQMVQSSVQKQNNNITNSNNNKNNNNNEYSIKVSELFKNNDINMEEIMDFVMVDKSTNNNQQIEQEKLQQQQVEIKKQNRLLKMKKIKPLEMVNTFDRFEKLLEKQERIQNYQEYSIRGNFYDNLSYVETNQNRENQYIKKQAQVLRRDRKFKKKII